MRHPTYVISVSPQAKWYVLIWFKYLIPLTCLKQLKAKLAYNKLVSVVFLNFIPNSTTENFPTSSCST